MKILQEKETELQSALERVKKLNALNTKIEGLLKPEGFKTLDAFVEALAEVSGEEAPAKRSTKRAAKKPAKGKKGKKGVRPRITEEDLKKMKALWDKDVSAADIAKKLNKSEASVYNWIKKKFKM